MKLSKRFKVGIFAWIVGIILFISDDLWVEFIAFEVFLALFIYDVILTKKSGLNKLLRVVSIVILGLFSTMLFLQKIHHNSIKKFKTNYDEGNDSRVKEKILFLKENEYLLVYC